MRIQVNLPNPSVLHRKMSIHDQIFHYKNHDLNGNLGSACTPLTLRPMRLSTLLKTVRGKRP